MPPAREARTPHRTTCSRSRSSSPILVAWGRQAPPLDLSRKEAADASAKVGPKRGELLPYGAGGRTPRRLPAGHGGFGREERGDLGPEVRIDRFPFLGSDIREPTALRLQRRDDPRHPLVGLAE